MVPQDLSSAANDTNCFLQIDPHCEFCCEDVPTPHPSTKLGIGGFLPALGSPPPLLVNTAKEHGSCPRDMAEPLTIRSCVFMDLSEFIKA